MVLSLLACSAAVAASEKTQLPRAKSRDVEVMRGSSEKIPLRGFHPSLHRLEYRIISEPRYGKLSGLRQYSGPDSQGPGVVTYTHGGDGDSTRDLFVYEAEDPITGLAGRGRVTIRILDGGGCHFPLPLDFGESAIGDPPAQRNLEFSNTTDGILRGSVEVPEPFALLGDGSYVLQPGEKASIPIVFRPERPGPYLFRLKPVPGNPSEILLKGEAVQPLAVEVNENRFIQQPDQSRTVRAMVKNQSKRPQEISVELPPEIPVEGIETMQIAAGSNIEVTLRIPPETKTRIEPFSVRFRGPDNAVTLNFHAPPVPAELLVVWPPEFGWVETRAAARATLVLSNTGGIALEGRLQMQEGLTVENGVTAFSIPPGTAQTIPLKFTPEDGKDLPTDIVILSGGREIPIPILPQREGDGPFCDIGSVYKPSPAGLALNTEVKLQTADGAAYILFCEGANWENVTLQHRPKGADEWRDYIMPKPDKGLIAWIRTLIQEITSTTSKPGHVEGLELDEGWGSIEIATSEIDGADVWRLLAVARNRNGRQPATQEFYITSEGFAALKPFVLRCHGFNAQQSDRHSYVPKL